jgi:DHA1 family multidrug resistance protein-like MFS transporter
MTEKAGMPEEPRGATGDPEAATAASAAGQWQRTLWVMVGIQFIMTGAFSVLSPIMPLLLPELGVETASAINLWAGILNGVTSFVAAFASPI